MLAKKDRILYFSSTGNSFYIAKRMGERFGAEPEYIPKVTERNIDAERVTVISPVYSCGLPVHVYEFLSELKTSAELYVVLNYGGAPMGADRLAYDLCAERGLNIRAVHKLKMVENFTLVFTVPAPYRNMILKKAPSRVESVIERIEAASAFQPKAKTCRRKVYEKTGLNGLK